MDRNACCVEGLPAVPPTNGWYGAAADKILTTEYMLLMMMSFVSKKVSVLGAR